MTEDFYILYIRNIHNVRRTLIYTSYLILQDHDSLGAVVQIAIRKQKQQKNRHNYNLNDNQKFI